MSMSGLKRNESLKDSNLIFKKKFALEIFCLHPVFECLWTDHRLYKFYWRNIANRLKMKPIVERCIWT